MNVDSLKTYNSINSITHHLANNNNIDIACIQETHNNNDDFIIKNGYAIYFSGFQNQPKSNSQIKGGVAIAIKENFVKMFIKF